MATTETKAGRQSDGTIVSYGWAGSADGLCRIKRIVHRPGASRGETEWTDETFPDTARGRKAAWDRTGHLNGCEGY